MPATKSVPQLLPQNPRLTLRKCCVCDGIYTSPCKIAACLLACVHASFILFARKTTFRLVSVTQKFLLPAKREQLRVSRTRQLQGSINRLLRSNSKHRNEHPSPHGDTTTWSQKLAWLPCYALSAWTMCLPVHPCTRVLENKLARPQLACWLW